MRELEKTFFRMYCIFNIMGIIAFLMMVAVSKNEVPAKKEQSFRGKYSRATMCNCYETRFGYE